MEKVLVWGPVEDKARWPQMASMVACARQCASCVDVLAVNGSEEAHHYLSHLEGVSTVLTATTETSTVLPEDLSQVLMALSQQYSHILVTSDAVGKAALPRLAAMLNMNPVSDIHSVKGPKTFERAIYAGVLNEIVEVPAEKVLATVRTTAFAGVGEQAQAALLQPTPWSTALKRLQIVRVDNHRGDRPDLMTAKTVVAGGRGLHDEEGFKALERLADKMGAAVGATRTAVDMGLAPNDWQIGQTGKMVAPSLYIAFGISGAIQHTAGIKDAGCVVAINTDPEAAIFEVADLGLVMDALPAMAALENALV